MEFVFMLCACVSILAVALICIFLFANGVPAMAKIGFGKFLLGQHLAGRKWPVWNLSNDHRKYLCYSRSDHCRSANWNFGSSIFGKVLP